MTEGLPEGTVTNLIVVLRAEHKCGARLISHSRAARLASSGQGLSLVEKATVQAPGKLLCSASKISVVTVTLATQEDPGGMMEIISPHAIQAVAACIAWSNEPNFITLILGDENHRAWRCHLTHPFREFHQDMRGTVVTQVMGGIQPKSIDVVLADPVDGILNDKTHAPGNSRARRN